MLEIDKIRADFPILSQKIYDKPLVYLDNAATTQKPLAVIEAITNFYSFQNSSIHRGVYYLSEKATEAYEHARKTVANFINAKNTSEIIFTKGATESINLVAFSYGEKFVGEGDEILLTEMNHHSNIVPWQLLCERKGAKIRVIPINEAGELQIDEVDKLLTPKTKIVAITQVSNSLGTIVPVEKIIQKAHKLGIPVLVDGAQSVQHLEVDVQKMDCDFFVFSGHKIYAETGIGVLYGKEKWLDAIPPYQGGGDMIKSVTFEKTTFNELPFKFEAGTTNFVGAMSLDVAIQYIQKLGIPAIAHYENELLQYATKKLTEIEGLRIYGTSKHKSAVISFLINEIHHFDTGMILDKMGIAVRTGTHCTQPVMDKFGITGTVRASFSFYNTKSEIDVLCAALKRVKDMF